MHDLAALQPILTVFLRKSIDAIRLEVDFAVRHHPNSTPSLSVDFTGPDSVQLTAHNAELLRALEHLSAQILRLEADQHALLFFDADCYKHNRELNLQASARSAAAHVRRTGLPVRFAPMSSYERRQLHLILNAMGLATASTGEGLARKLILYPPSPAGHSAKIAL